MTEKQIPNSNCSPEAVYPGQKWYLFTCKMVLKKYLSQTIYVIVTRIFRSAFIIRGRLFTATQEHITSFSKSTDCSLIGSIVSNWIMKIRVIFLFSLSCFILQYLGLAVSSTNFSSPKLNEMAICSIQFTLGLPISHACKIFSEYTLGDHFWRRLWNHRLWSVSKSISCLEEQFVWNCLLKHSVSSTRFKVTRYLISM